MEIRLGEGFHIIIPGPLMFTFQKIHFTQGGIEQVVLVQKRVPLKIIHYFIPGFSSLPFPGRASLYGRVKSSWDTLNRADNFRMIALETPRR